MKSYKVYTGNLSKDSRRDTARVFIHLGWLPDKDNNGKAYFDKINADIYEDWMLTVPEEDDKLFWVLARRGFMGICKY